MNLEYDDLLEYGGRKIDSEKGCIELPKVIEGYYKDLGYSVARPERAKDIPMEAVRSFNKNNQDPFTQLKNYVLNTEDDIFYVDEHNHALAGWLAAYNEDLLEGDTLLFHIDAHEDAEEPEPFYPPENTGDAEELIGDMLEINEFIYPSKQWGIVDNQVNWGVEDTAIERLTKEVSQHSVIVDVDLDVFKNIDDLEPAYSKLDDLISGADFTTIATSPGYIHQEEALKHLENIIEK